MSQPSQVGCSNLLPGDRVRVARIMKGYDDDDQNRRYLGREGIIETPGQVEVEDFENIVSFENDGGDIEMAVFTDEELELIGRSIREGRGWFSTLKSKLHLAGY